MKTYKGYDIFKHDPNSSGLRWYTYGKEMKLRADTLQGIKQLINQDIKE